MKRFFLMWGLVITLLLSGCGSSASRVETLKSWSFQYNEGTSDYSLFFGLADKNDKSLSADVDVDIRIVNDADEEVYAGTKSVSPDDFGYYTSQAAGEQYLANVRIPAAEIKAGKSASGKVYFTYSPQLNITITGEKKSGSENSGYDMISYKLFDSAGYMIDSGDIYLSALSAGDKFKDDSVVIYDIVPGETYVFRLSEYN